MIGHAGIEIARRPPQRDRKPHTTPRAPRVHAIGGEGTNDGYDHAARRSAKAFALLCVPTHPSYPPLPVLPYLPLQPIDLNAERYAALSRRGVRAKLPFDHGKSLVVFR